jgi:hypothetical protein
MATEYNKVTRNTPIGLNFSIFNQLICNNTDFELSQRNLIMMYSYLYIFIQYNLTNYLETFLNNTSYFNKIIFLKYLMFFRKFNELQQKIQENKEKMTQQNIQFEQEVKNYTDSFGQIEDENANYTQEQKASILNKRKNFVEKTTKFDTETRKFSNFKQKFITKTKELLVNNFSDLETLLPKNIESTQPIESGIDNIINSLFNKTIIDNIYNTIIENINNNYSVNYNEYLTLFHLNNQPINNSSSAKAIFFIGFHGTLLTVDSNNHNQYLTIKTPVKTTINRWGKRGDPTKFFNSMKYTFKQCLLMNDLNYFNANSCFELLGTSQEQYNYHTSQTTTAYCEKPQDSGNNKIRIKHYTVDSYSYMIFNTIPDTLNSNYTIPDTLFNNLSLKIPRLTPELKNIQYNTAENIINLNFLLFTNNIDFNVFNRLNIKTTPIPINIYDLFNLYPDIGLYTKNYIKEGDTFLKTDLLNFYFPLDIFSFDHPELFIEDFVLERDIFALNDINIRLTYQKVDRTFVDISFVLFKGDSFSCNPYIIEYFINKFNSKITIRPGPILGNKSDEIFKQNTQQGTTREHGSTITCLSKGLSCYKVTLSVLTNYEILQFCKDANITECDLYDTSCQSFGYIDESGGPHIPINDDNTKKRKFLLQRMNTYNDTTILPKYDNLSDIYFRYMTKNKPNFLVVGNIPNVDSNETPDLKLQRIGGKTKKRINRKKNTRKQTKKSKTKNSRKQKKQKTKRYTNRITL